MIRFRPTERSPERALFYGPMSAGKTLNALHVVSKCLAPGETLFFVSTDNSYAKFEKRFDGLLSVREEWDSGGAFSSRPGGMERLSEFEVEGGNVVLLNATDWESFKWCMEKAWTEARRGDWIVVDSLTHPWQWVVEWYIRLVHGAGLPEYLIKYRVDQIAAQKNDSQGAGALLVEYNYVNKVWSEVFLTPYVNARCHVIVTAEAKEVRTDDRGDKKDIRQLYGNVGMKPDSQRRIGANSQTVLYFEQANKTKAEWLVTTVKDRERERLIRVTLGYEGVGATEGEGLDRVWLKGVAGWVPRKVDG